MSAFTVGKDHIDLMVTVALTLSEFRADVLDLVELGTRLGRELWQENYNSVNYRYSEEEVPPEYEWQPVLGYDTLDLDAQHALTVLGAANCYDYQTCEHPGWLESKARWVSQALQVWATGRLKTLGVDAEEEGGGAWEFRRDAEEPA